jgi:hypothetical protein
MHLNESDVTTASSMTRYLRTNDVRLSAAVEVHTPARDNAVSGALGVYGVASLDMWTNKFHLDGDDKMRDLQFEGGVYVSGVMKGFSGLIMLSVIRPYTPGAQNVYAVSIVPFAGASPAAGSQATGSQAAGSQSP